MVFGRAGDSYKRFTQIPRKGAAANEADFAKRLLADIYAKSAKLTAAQPPLCREFEGQPPLLRDGVFPSARDVLGLRIIEIARVHPFSGKP